MRPFLALGCLILITAPTSAQQKAKLPDGAVVQIGMPRLRVAGNITDHAFSPDQCTLVVIHDEKDVHKPNVVLFDVATGLERKRLPIRGAQHIAMARDKPLMVVDSYHGIEVWDLAADKRVQQWDFPECVDEAGAVAISPDGSTVIAAMPALLRWNVTTGAALTSFKPRDAEYPIYALHFSSDGNKLVAYETYPRSYRSRYFGPIGYDASMMFEGANWYALPLSGMAGPKTRLLQTTLWSLGKQTVFRKQEPLTTILDAKTGAKLLEIGTENGPVIVSPDASLVALTGGRGLNSALRIDLRRAERGWPYVGSITGSTIVFSPDGKRAVVDQAGIWNIATRKRVQGITQYGNGNVRFSPDGKLLALVKSDPNDAPSPYSRYSRDFTVSPYGIWEQSNNHLQIVDLTTGKPKNYADGYSEAVGGLAYSPDGKWLASFSRDTLFMHDARTGAELRRWTAHKAPIVHFAFSPDGKSLASTSLDNHIVLWDPMTGKEQRRLSYQNQRESLLAFSSDRKMLISLAEGNVVRRWNLIEGKTIDSMQPMNMATAALSPNGDFVAYLSVDQETNSVRLQWLNTRTGKKLGGADSQITFGQGSGSDSLVFSTDGKLLAASGYLPMADDKLQHALRVWENATQREVARFSINQVPTRLLALSPDGRVLAHGFSTQAQIKTGYGNGESMTLYGTPECPRGIILRDVVGTQNDKDLRPITAHLGPVTCLAFSPDGKFLATGGADQVVYVWRVEHFFKPGELPKPKASLVDYWPVLAELDAGNAHRAMAQLQRRPQDTSGLLRKQIKPAVVTESKVIDKHLRDLASGNFAVRSQANLALEKLGAEAATQLKAAVAKPANLEVKRRLETLLDKLDRPFENPDNLRVYRSLTVLERIGTPEARQLLEELSRGAPSSWLTAEARLSVQRLSTKPRSGDSQ